MRKFLLAIILIVFAPNAYAQNNVFKEDIYLKLSERGRELGKNCIENPKKFEEGESIYHIFKNNCDVEFRVGVYNTNKPIPKSSRFLKTRLVAPSSLVKINNTYELLTFSMCPTKIKEEIIVDGEYSVLSGEYTFDLIAIYRNDGTDRDCLYEGSDRFNDNKVILSEAFSQTNAMRALFRQAEAKVLEDLRRERELQEFRKIQAKGYRSKDNLDDEFFQYLSSEGYAEAMDCVEMIKTRPSGSSTIYTFQNYCPEDLAVSIVSHKEHKRLIDESLGLKVQFLKAKSVGEVKVLGREALWFACKRYMKYDFDGAEKYNISPGPFEFEVRNIYATRYSKNLCLYTGSEYFYENYYTYMDIYTK